MFKTAEREQQTLWTPPTWEELVRDHTDQVFRLALRLTGNRHDAEDLTQDVFLRAFRSIHTFTPGNLDGWLMRITTNLFLDQARRSQRVRLEPVAEPGERAADEGECPDGLLDSSRLDCDVAQALADLPAPYRACVVLCDVEQLSYQEIADLLGLKVGTVRSRIHRGRNQLRRCLQHRQPGLGRHHYLGIS